MPIKIDFTNVKGQFDAVPNGKYLASVYSVKEFTSKSGFPNLSWDFIIVGGESDGIHVSANTSLQPKALWKLQEFLRAFGLGADGLLTFEPSSLEGRQVIIHTKNEVYEGTERSKVQKLEAYDSGDESLV